MLTTELRKIYAMRTTLVLANLRNCNSGSEIHEVGNMRNIATLILDMLECSDTIDADHVKPVLERLEKAQQDFFCRKFGTHFHRS